MNCEEESHLLDKDLSQQPFGDLISMLRSSTIGVIILTGKTKPSSTIPPLKPATPGADREPLEFLWLPDSTGFLYRTYGRVYYYNLLTRSKSVPAGFRTSFRITGT